MAIKLPLVVINGVLQELPIGYCIETFIGGNRGAYAHASQYTNWSGNIDGYFSMSSRTISTTTWISGIHSPDYRVAAAASNKTKGFLMGGATSQNVNSFNFSTMGTASSNTRLSATYNFAAGCSNMINAFIIGGVGKVNTIKSITFSNDSEQEQSFGTLPVSDTTGESMASFSNTHKALVYGGATLTSAVANISVFTMATSNSASNYGDATRVGMRGCAYGNSYKGIFSHGCTINDSTIPATDQRFSAVIATTGTTTSWGNVFAHRIYVYGGMSDGIYGAVCIGYRTGSDWGTPDRRSAEFCAIETNATAESILNGIVQTNNFYSNNQSRGENVSLAGNA